MKKILFVAFVLFFLQGCLYAVRYDGTYSGKVIDAETGQSLEGVVVLGVWYVIYPNPAGAWHEYYDARETVTDENGEFRIPGMGLRVLSNLEVMDVVIFKTGYRYVKASWGFRGYYTRKIVKWEGDKPIIPLKKLTMEERRRQRMPDFYIGNRYDEKENITHSCLPKNIKLLPNAVNKELSEQGRKPYDLEGGRCEK